LNWQHHLLVADKPPAFLRLLQSNSLKAKESIDSGSVIDATQGERHTSVPYVLRVTRSVKRLIVNRKSRVDCFRKAVNG